MRTHRTECLAVERRELLARRAQCLERAERMRQNAVDHFAEAAAAFIDETNERVGVSGERRAGGQEGFLEALQCQPISERTSEIDTAAEQNQLAVIRETFTPVLELLRERQHCQPQHARAQQQLRFGQRSSFMKLDAVASIAKRWIHRKAQSAAFHLALEREWTEIPSSMDGPRSRCRTRVCVSPAHRTTQRVQVAALRNRVAVDIDDAQVEPEMIRERQRRELLLAHDDPAAARDPLRHRRVEALRLVDFRERACRKLGYGHEVLAHLLRQTPQELGDELEPPPRNEP